MVSSSTSSLITKKKDNDVQENLWTSILSEVQQQGSTKLPSCKNVLVLGNNESGKTTLVAKLQGVEDPKKGSGLEYAYIDVRDEYRDDHTRLSVWVLDGDAGHTNLLKFSLSEETFEHTLVILTVSMTAPWGWKEQLEHWTEILKNHMKNLDLTKEQRELAHNQLVHCWQGYCEPGDELDPGSPVKRLPKRDMSRSSISDLDDSDDTLTEGALLTNLGLEIVVVVTKTDYMTTLEKELDYRDEHWDFMQQWIRRFCLEHGAALFYTSAKEDKNCDLLYKYLTHRIYGFPFRTPALVVEKDAVLIPAGWDNLKKISILHENLHTCKPDDEYSEIIAQPATRKSVTSRENEIVAEDEQAFLARQQNLLQSNGVSNLPLGPGGSTLRGSESPLRPSVSLTAPRTPSTAVQSPKKMDGVKMVPGTPGGEGVLANFFNSLLHKKAPTPLNSPKVNLNMSGSELSHDQQAGLRSDAAAELDRLTRNKKTPSSDVDSSEC